MSDINYDMIYIIVFLATLIVICFISYYFCGDRICSKLKDCCYNYFCKNDKQSENVVQEV